MNLQTDMLLDFIKNGPSVCFCRDNYIFLFTPVRPDTNRYGNFVPTITINALAENYISQLILKIRSLMLESLPVKTRPIDGILYDVIKEALIHRANHLAKRLSGIQNHEDNSFNQAYFQLIHFQTEINHLLTHLANKIKTRISVELNNQWFQNGNVFGAESVIDSVNNGGDQMEFLNDESARFTDDVVLLRMMHERSRRAKFALRTPSIDIQSFQEKLLTSCPKKELNHFIEKLDSDIFEIVQHFVEDFEKQYSRDSRLQDLGRYSPKKLKNFYRIGHFEIDEKVQTLMVALHTGPYIIENYNFQGQVEYFRFPDAKCALFFNRKALAEGQILQGLETPLMVANQWSYHPFLKSSQSGFQQLCTGTTEMITNSPPDFLQGVFQALYYGKQVLMQGWHSNNKNPPHHRFRNEMGLLNPEFAHNKISNDATKSIYRHLPISRFFRSKRKEITNEFIH